MYFVIGHSFSQVMNQVAAISKKLKDITRENTDIKDDVKEISQFLIENNLSVVKDQDQSLYGQQPYIQNNTGYQGYPGYQDPTDIWDGWEYSPNRSFGYSTPRRITPMCDLRLSSGSPFSAPVPGPRLTIVPMPTSTSQRPTLHGDSPLFNARLLADIKEISQSRYNFAVNLVRYCFDEEAQRRSNMSGRCNKQRLDPKKISQIQEATFQMYPCADGEGKLSEWRKCHRAIDESCRRLNRKIRSEDVST